MSNKALLFIFTISDWSLKERLVGWKIFFRSTFFLKQYFYKNTLIWQEGLLIDFLQKKIVDRWTKRFLISSGYLFNERALFDYVIRFYIDLVIWPGQKSMIFELKSVGSVLFFIVLFWFFSTLAIYLLYILLVLF